ncbi:hypothetical protein SY2F82_45700 [Streptomyces sp. Y2F8-2]|nr:hypothetical protein SY2F82_45700 [Streptomyces sp. Y2F8-2]
MKVAALMSPWWNGTTRMASDQGRNLHGPHLPLQSVPRVVPRTDTDPEDTRAAPLKRRSARRKNRWPPYPPVT